MEDHLTELAAVIVASFVENNDVAANDLPALIEQVRLALSSAGGQSKAQAEAVMRLTPSQVQKSITPDYLVSFIDGRRYKTLDQHLATHGLTFERYRERFGLPDDYPSTAPNYRARRSELAKALGLRPRRPRRSPEEPRGAEDRCISPT